MSEITMRRKAVFASLMVLVVFGLIVWWSWPRDRLTPENLAKVRVGMSLAQVKELLGEPLDLTDYTMAIGFDPKEERNRYYSLISKSAFFPRLDMTDVDILEAWSRTHIW